MTLNSYITGFVLSLVTTLAAFWLVYMHVESEHLRFTHETLVLLLILLAIVQCALQLKFFLHMHTTPSWNLSILILALFITAFVVLGSLWIMSHLKHETRIPFDGEVTPLNEH